MSVCQDCSALVPWRCLVFLSILLATHSFSCQCLSYLKLNVDDDEKLNVDDECWWWSVFLLALEKDLWNHTTFDTLVKLYKLVGPASIYPFPLAIADYFCEYVSCVIVKCMYLSSCIKIRHLACLPETNSKFLCFWKAKDLKAHLCGTFLGH